MAIEIVDFDHYEQWFSSSQTPNFPEGQHIFIPIPAVIKHDDSDYNFYNIL